MVEFPLLFFLQDARNIHESQSVILLFFMKLKFCSINCIGCLGRNGVAVDEHPVAVDEHRGFHHPLLLQ